MSFSFHLTTKWQRKLHMGDDPEEENKDSEDSALRTAVKSVAVGFKTPLFWVPFVTVIREGLEGMIFLGGTAIGSDAGAIPLAVLGGLALATA
ncbi:UNVERIFIED_CONTAM: hypothetical protein HDU68_010520 [Siphonaria sp. JEL0065]|nr:hypothetical protein HDU68_010520 [Siphonaria sp. JEL0065]